MEGNKEDAWRAARQVRRLSITHKHGPMAGRLYTFGGSFLGVAVCAGLAWLTKEPLIFPSLGPTAFLAFADPPTRAGSPRNIILGHGIALVIGFVCLVVFGLRDVGPALAVGVSTTRVLAAATSVGTTGLLLHVLRAPHAPAGATTLIVSLGLLRTPRQLAAMAVAVLVMTVVTLLVHRLLRVDSPWWGEPDPLP